MNETYKKYVRPDGSMVLSYEAYPFEEEVSGNPPGDERKIVVTLGSHSIIGRSQEVRTQAEARSYISALNKAEEVVSWNCMMSAKTISHNEARSRILSLWEWMSKPTTYKYIKPDFYMKGLVLLDGAIFSVAFRDEILRIYETKGPLVSSVRSQLGIPDVFSERLEFINSLDITPVSHWNNHRSTKFTLDIHPTVRATLDNKGVVLRTRPEGFPPGWHT